MDAHRALEELGDETDDVVGALSGATLGFQDGVGREDGGQSGPVLGVEKAEVAGLELLDLLDGEEALHSGLALIDSILYADAG